MGIIRSGSKDAAHYFECRHCGTTVDAGTDVCPACESPDIVEYDLA